jgi:hypothetical protein
LKDPYDCCCPKPPEAGPGRPLLAPPKNELEDEYMMEDTRGRHKTQMSKVRRMKDD